MARYIDPYALLSKLPNDLPYKASVKRVLMQAQEADVVPKIEVAALKIELEAMRTAANAYKMRCDAIIQDIAKACAPHDHHLNSLDFEIGYITAMNKVIAQLEEIKKKYTESGGLYEN